ncbi:hypothetical protein PTNB73_01878 [Pyrenophora teres f. teres]|nr:hypothetical protein HRS9139_00464 [Pyrenophora teres f. teres]KAE8848035.1 hypothetical protein PTNB85_01878 [Pyrenophora teres f. teres]KAE8853802.1 hypothetical protein HRS9122_00794 [Pyrenophora teres f. teres]KAE8872727.1 hypothetical protein PTNB73_01878 [Pyrenophora teres f. teres]
MSGIEVAGLVFGVLPILFEAVRAYSAISKGLHTFRHWSKEVRSIALQLKVNDGIFLNECRLLLRLVEDEQAAEYMLKDQKDWRWTSKELNDKLGDVLKNSLDICCSIIQETKDIAETMEEEMKKFNILQEQKQKDEMLKFAIKRLRGAVTICFDKSKFEKGLSKLRDRNGELAALRQQMAAFQQNARTLGTLVNHKALPSRFQSIQSASQKLHEALSDAWCCDDLAHRGHCAKLCLDAEAQTEVHLDLAISCHELTAGTDNFHPGEPPIWLYVQSMSMISSQCLATTSEPMASLKKALPAGIYNTSPTNTLKKKASSDLAQPTISRKKAKRVHFGDETAASSVTPSTLATAVSPITIHLNLCLEKSICNYLKRSYRACGGSPTKNCVGYLETPQLYKHMFFARHKTPNIPEYNTVYSVFDIMQQEADDALDVQDQLKLAHKAAVAILQYNNTPWLPERWRLNQLGYFGSGTNFDETALKTLHLSSQISTPHQSIPPTAMDGIEAANQVSDEIRYGINNLPLFFLGVALLEIAHWKPLEEKMIARDCSDQVYAARRLACGRAPLGPEYQKIAQKCLQCNFGFGTKLNSKGLQAAVYNDVVCELEDIIEKLSI